MSAKRLASRPTPRPAGSRTSFVSVELGSAAVVAVRGRRGRVVRLLISTKTVGRLAERCAQLRPGAHETFADVSGTLTQRLRSLPHLACRIARRLCRAYTSLVKGSLGFARLLPGCAARVIELLLGRLPALCGLRLYLLKIRLQRRHDMAAKCSRVHL